MTASVGEVDFDKMDPLQYSILVDQREVKVRSTNLRFALQSSINPFVDIEPKRKFCCIKIKE